MSARKKFNVKIAKTATQRSIMDVTSSLNYHKTKGDEEVYKGKVIFSITEVGKDKYLKAFMDKATAKAVCHTIINHSFGKIFGEQGMTDYGGSVGDEVRSRTLNIKKGSGKYGPQFIFTIQEGEGFVDQKTGSIKMKKGANVTSVQTYVSLIDALKLAHEVLDYIQQEEMMAMQEGKPLYTLSYYNSTKMTETQPNNKEEYNNQSFAVPIGDYEGKSLDELSNKDLIGEYKRLEADNKGYEDYFQEVKKEVKRRKKQQAAS